MEPIFPSGRVSVSIQDLQDHQPSQPACNICHKRWYWESFVCTLGHLCVLHPCQHLVGSGCWETVPEEHRDKCPVCNVTIGREEQVQIVRPDNKVSLDDKKKVSEGVDIDLKKEMGVKGKLRERISPSDVALILYLVNMRNSWDTGRPWLGMTGLLPIIAHIPGYRRDVSAARTLAIELHAFNILRGTNFSLGDVKVAVSSAGLKVIWHLYKALQRNEMNVPRVLPQDIEDE